MAWLQAFLIKYPELAVLLLIAIGYVIGASRRKGIGLGPVTGSLVAGVLIGRVAEVPVSGMTKSFPFLLFLFGIGYSVGPLSGPLRAADEPDPDAGSAGRGTDHDGWHGCGAGTVGEPIAGLGYTPAYPFGRILLTTWDTIVVGLVAAA